jgi:enoyl-CoA hydratase/carnithine racemase
METSVTSEESSVLVEYRPDGVVVVQLNRPQVRNALNLACRHRLAELFGQLTHNDEVRCVVLTGAEGMFCAGADLREYAEAGAIEIAHRNLQRLWASITDCPHPIVAAVQGFALGGGCELAMRADIIIAGETARFGQPEVRVGLIPGAGGTQYLTRILGKFVAMRLLLTGEQLTAREALERGLVSRVVPDAEVFTVALEVARSIAVAAPLAVRNIKELVVHGMDGSLESGSRLEHKAFQVLFASRDKAEGIRAFLEKRAPRFRGC